jgi:hypothetical protein
MMAMIALRTRGDAIENQRIEQGKSRQRAVNEQLIGSKATVKKDLSRG